MSDFAIADFSGSDGQPSQYVDRRQLSEAWYDALYHNVSQRAKSTPTAPKPTRPALVQQRPTTTSPQRSTPTARPLTASEPRRAGGERRGINLASTAAEAAREREELGEIIERRAAEIDRRSCAVQMRVSHVAGGDVHLFLTQRSDTLRLVAVCSSTRSKERVNRVLGSVGQALAARGITFSFEVHTA